PNNDYNPFRPDGDLSHEADDIIEAIRLGRPLSPTTTEAPSVEEEIARIDVARVNAAPPGGRDETDAAQQMPPQNAVSVANSKPADVAVVTTPPKVATPPPKVAPPEDGQTVEVQAGVVVPPSDGVVQAEHVTIEKKKKCCGGCAIL
ncbi:PREDICTED: uncharacterized protein LOC106818271, partial [Priapulus caudatus]|uniref:Uncharacterized protein LOC106818271 n=1 Tax=Priapulus caudatus TaxID=37621 RepID=A0ABM1F207_PRICU